MDTPTRSRPVSSTPGSHAHIPGWGADLDPADRPAYPKERMPARLEVPWSHPEQQLQTVEILHSNERAGVTPLFGTPQPPSGLSGSLRRLAFKFSENDLRHWLILLFADRVNVVEGLGEDLRKGHLPNVFAEMGGPAEFTHNRGGAVKKVALASVAIVLLLWLRSRRRGR